MYICNRLQNTISALCSCSSRKVTSLVSTSNLWRLCLSMRPAIAGKSIDYSRLWTSRCGLDSEPLVGDIIAFIERHFRSHLYYKPLNDKEIVSCELWKDVGANGCGLQWFEILFYLTTIICHTPSLLRPLMWAVGWVGCVNSKSKPRGSANRLLPEKK